VPFDVAWRRYTKDWEKERVLKRVDDYIFGETCMFLDQRTRRCTVYHARPGTCREYPARSRCAYYDLLQFERKQQGNDTVVPVIQLTFRNVEQIEVGGEDGPEKRWAWERDEF
jgi:Fe-S-cluster containining protein